MLACKIVGTCPSPRRRRTDGGPRHGWSARFRARAGLALHRGLMQAYRMRAQMVQRIWEERTGMSAVTGLELRFQ